MHDFRLLRVIEDLKLTGYVVEPADGVKDVFFVYHRMFGLPVGVFSEKKTDWSTSLLSIVLLKDNTMPVKLK